MVTPIEATYRESSTALRPSRRPARSAPGPRAHLCLIDQPEPLHPILCQRDFDLIRRVFPLLTSIADHYFRSEVEGLEHFPEQAGLIVSTHNGGLFMPDLYCLMVAVWRRFGLETPGYGLLHGAAFNLPGLGSFLPKLGAIPASPENAKIALRANVPLLVCPGGDADSLKPFRDRHKIKFGSRRGFIRLAIREQVPIVPTVSVGAHETLFVLNDGRRLAELTGFAKHFRIKSMPLALGFPFGLSIGGLMTLPLPAKIKVRMLEPIEFAEPPEAADDEAVVERCFEHVRSKMQTALTKLASQRRWPVIG